MRFEISSKANYTRKLEKPVWPGGASGVTIGIGYDLGYVSASRVKEDWGGVLPEKTVELLASVAGAKKTAAKRATAMLRTAKVKIPINLAIRVFFESTLPRYAKRTAKAYPGIDDLPPDAQAMLLSLVYNRGAALSGSRRKEMKAIRALVKKQDLDGIADQFVSMKRLWEGKGLDGLLKRRDKEAAMIRKAKRRYKKSEQVFV